MKAFNLFDGELDHERDGAGRLHLARCAARPEARRRRSSARASTSSQPGERSFPYHYEYGGEEWLVVVAGRPTLRDPEGEHELRPGDVVCFPEGPEGAHQVRNDTDEPIRVLIASTKSLPDAAVYPDSGKIGIWTGNDADPPRLFRIGTARRLLGGRSLKALRKRRRPHGRRGVVSCGIAWASCGGANERGPTLRPAFYLSLRQSRRRQHPRFGVLGVADQEGSAKHRLPGDERRSAEPS